MHLCIAHALVNGNSAEILKFAALGIVPFILDYVWDRSRIGWPRRVKITIEMQW